MGLSAFTVAEWFISHNNKVIQYNSAERISNLKIQKLLYYAQGCSLASMNRELFSEDIVAWRHGPVVEQVYKKYQHFGSDGIADDPSLPALDLNIEKLLINTYNTFARYSAWELANLTHKEEPWKLTPINQVIPIILIKNYFSVHYSTVNDENELTENIELLREFAEYEADWDGEGGLPFSTGFIQEVIELVSTLQQQPDIGATGRGSIDLEYGSVKDGYKYMNLEIFEIDKRVHIYTKDEAGSTHEEDIGMEEVNGYIQQF